MSHTAPSITLAPTVRVDQPLRATALPSVLLLIAFVAAMYDTLASLFELWWGSDGYGHGFVILGVTAYLLYMRKDELTAVRSRISIPGLLITAALIGLWFTSRKLSVLIGEQVVLVLLIVALVMALHGAKMVRIVALPILYLFCAIPIWSYLTPLLQDTTAQVATQMSRALGVPVYLEGIYMTIPDGVFLVAEVCAGISYLLAALSLGGFSALLNLRGTWTRLALVILALGAGLVFNWIRVAGIVLIGHHSNMQSPIVHSHITYGWVLFLLVVLFVLVCCRFLERVDVSNERRGYSPQTPRTDSIAQINDSPDKNTRTMWAMAISCAVMLAVPTYASIRTTPASLHSAADFLPELVGRHSDWLLTPATAPPHGWTASLLGPDLNVRASFIKGQQRLDLQLGYFASQHQGSEAVNDRHAKFDTASWQRVSQTISAEHVSIGPNLKVNEWSIRRTNTTERRLVWWWYWVDQQFTADPVQAKILQIRSIFSGHQQAAIVVISSPNLGTIENTRNEMVAWLRESATPLALGLSKLSRAPPPGGPCDT